MPPSEFLRSFLSGSPGIRIRLLAARGSAPVPPEEALELLVLLLGDPEQEVAREAERTLGGWTEAEVSALLKSPACSERVFMHFTATSSSPLVREAIVLNASAPNDAVATIAANAPPDLAEAILYNRQRLLDCPDILRRLNSNPSLTDRLRAQIREIESEYFGVSKQEYRTLGEEASDTTSSVEASYVEGGPGGEELTLDSIPWDSTAGEGSIHERLAHLSVPQKIKYALHGTREIRAMLIRDPTKDVARSVLRSPKLTEAEVVAFSAMRNVSDDVLRLIAANRKWLASYSVILNLVRNPKTPVYLSQKMIMRLHRKDLLQLSKDREIPDAIRRNAFRLAKKRSSGG